MFLHMIMIIPPSSRKIRQLPNVIDKSNLLCQRFIPKQSEKTRTLWKIFEIKQQFLLIRNPWSVKLYWEKTWMMKHHGWNMDGEDFFSFRQSCYAKEYSMIIQKRLNANYEWCRDYLTFMWLYIYESSRGGMSLFDAIHAYSTWPIHCKAGKMVSQWFCSGWKIGILQIDASRILQASNIRRIPRTPITICTKCVHGLFAWAWSVQCSQWSTADGIEANCLHSIDWINSLQ